VSSRIDDIFARQQAAGRTGLIPFVTGGYPNLAATAAVLPALEEVLGPDGGIVEIGIPFSDPIADGPVIAASMHDALEAGVTPPDVFETVRRLRGAGFDGLIVPDLTGDGEGDGRGEDFGRMAAGRGLCFSMLVAPTTPPQRLERIVSRCRGFVYVLARVGITGERQAPPDVAGLVEAVRGLTDLPVAVGFGISRPEHVAAVTAVADAAVVGSAIVRRMGGAGDPARAAAEYAATLTAALAPGRAKTRPGPTTGPSV
jgi:tryptophan synthase alpha chain